jgi:hypothetical protein
MTWTPTGTAVGSITATPTVTGSGGEFTLSQEKVYPCPYNPKNGDLTFEFSCTRNIRELTVKIYTSNLRFVHESKDTQMKYAGFVSTSIKASYLARLANGAYYYVIEARSDTGSTAKTKIGIVIVIK